MSHHIETSALTKRFRELRSYRDIVRYPVAHGGEGRRRRHLYYGRPG